MTRELNENYQYYTSDSDKNVPFRKLAPESLLIQKYSNKSDVWSFAILLGEILTCGQTPYFELTNQEFLHFIKNGNTQTIDSRCPELMYFIKYYLLFINIKNAFNN